MCMILLLCLSMVLSAVGCIQDNTNDGTANKAESFNEISLEFFASLDEGDGEKFVTVLDCYAIDVCKHEIGCLSFYILYQECFHLFDLL